MSTARAPQMPGQHGSLAPGASLLHALAKNWWLEILRGVAAIIFGVLAIAAAIMGGNPMPRWWLAIVGITGIVAGGLTFLMPGLTLFVLLIFIGVWAIVLGIFEIYGAIKLRKHAPA